MFNLSFFHGNFHVFGNWLLTTGTVELDMLHLIPPAKTPEKCSLSMLTQTGKNLTPTSLFSQKSVRGWWPCAMEEDGKKILAVSVACKHTAKNKIHDAYCMCKVQMVKTVLFVALG